MTQGGVFLLIMALASHNQQAKAEAVQQAETACMAQALYYEARSEGVRGQEAVAEVVLHRVHSGRHPKTICGVVREPGQFSFLGDGSMLRKLDVEAWDKAKELSERILRREIVTSMTGRALFYHTVDVRPDWADSMVMTAQIGNHIFYRQAPKQRSS